MGEVSLDVAHVHDVIILLYYEYWTDKRKYFTYESDLFVGIKTIIDLCLFMNQVLPLIKLAR